MSIWQYVSMTVWQYVGMTVCRYDSMTVWNTRHYLEGEKGDFVACLKKSSYECIGVLVYWFSKYITDLRWRAGRWLNVRRNDHPRPFLYCLQNWPQHRHQVYLFLRLNPRSVAHLAHVTSMGHHLGLSHTAASCAPWPTKQNGRPPSAYLHWGPFPLYRNQTLSLADLDLPCETAS
jgi:hypothetical protein